MSPEVTTELEAIVSDREEESGMGSIVRVWDLLFHSPGLRKPLRIAAMMMLSQQWTGITAALYYSAQVFAFAGLDRREAQAATLVIGAANLVTTVLSLFVVDRAGRKTLMYAGVGGMAAATAALAACLRLAREEGAHPALPYAAVLCLVCLVTAYSVGPGTIPWYFVHELFALRSGFRAPKAHHLNREGNRVAATALAATLSEQLGW